MNRPVTAKEEPCLADRIGLTIHVSPLRFKLEALQREFPATGAECVEDWLVDIANSRGARIVVRPDAKTDAFVPPSLHQLSNEELTVGLCLLQSRDRPQLLRLAAQLISRKAVTFRSLRLIAIRERVSVILAVLARQALRVDPHHDLWNAIAQTFAEARQPREPILHWNRIAAPVWNGRTCQTDAWTLIA